LSARLVLAVVVPPAAWVAQLLAAYLVVSLACAKHVVIPLGSEGVFVLAAAASATALFAAIRARDRRSPTERFAARLAALGGGLFLVGILLVALPGVLLPRCG
jgi:hypothetical protein